MSSCEAKIQSANEGGKLTVGVRNLAKGFIKIGIPLPDIDGPTVLYNDNKAMVRDKQGLGVTTRRSPMNLL